MKKIRIFAIIIALLIPVMIFSACNKKSADNTPINPNPDVEPVRDNWTDAETFILNSLFKVTDGNDAIPFPKFASEELVVDGESIFSNDVVYVTDEKATEQNVNAYIAEIKTLGFVKATDEGRDVYRRVLRNEYRAYTSLYVAYDEGLLIEGRVYYDNPTFDSLDEINAHIKTFGYDELPASDNLTNWQAEERNTQETESWGYYYAYETSLQAIADFEDRDALNEYLTARNDYLLAKGYKRTSYDEEDGTIYAANYRAQDGITRVLFSVFDEANKLSITFKKYEEVTVSEQVALIEEAGFPTPNLPDTSIARDVTKYYQFVSGPSYKLYLMASITFDDEQGAIDFLDDYVDALIARTYLSIPADLYGSNKQYAFATNDGSLRVFFSQNANTVDIDFVKVEQTSLSTRKSIK